MTVSDVVILSVFVLVFVGVYCVGVRISHWLDDRHDVDPPRRRR
jgi:hypothetical protein